MGDQRLPDTVHRRGLGAGEHVFKDIVHPPGYPGQISRLQGPEHPPGVGPVEDAHPVDAAEELGRGDGEGGLAHHRMAQRQRGQRPEPLPAALGQHGAPHDAVGHIGAHLLPDAGQSLPAQAQGEALVQRAEHRRGVAAPSGHTGAHRDVLVQGNLQTVPVRPHRLAQADGRLGGQVFRSGGQKFQIGAHPDALFLPGADGHQIG